MFGSYSMALNVEHELRHQRQVDQCPTLTLSQGPKPQLLDLMSILRWKSKEADVDEAEVISGGKITILQFGETLFPFMNFVYFDKRGRCYEQGGGHGSRTRNL